MPMPYSRKRNWVRTLLFENTSYKLVALFISFVLWISILSRRDYVANFEVELNFVTASGYSIASQSSDKIKLKISGQQPLMKKYKDHLQTLSIDVGDRTEGVYDIDILASRFDIPQGIKILSIRPNLVKFEIVKSDR